MAQKRLGDAGTALFKRQRTGAEALAEASGVREEEPRTSIRNSVRERADEGNWVVTTFRIRKDQWRWLRQLPGCAHAGSE